MSNDMVIENLAPLSRGDYVANDESVEIARNLKAQLLARRFSQREMAARLEVDPGHMSRLLNGRRNFQLDQVIQAADILDCAIEALVPTGSRLDGVLQCLDWRADATQGAQESADTSLGGLVPGQMVALRKPVDAMTPVELTQLETELKDLFSTLAHRHEV